MKNRGLSRGKTTTLKDKSTEELWAEQRKLDRKAKRKSKAAGSLEVTAGTLRSEEAEYKRQMKLIHEELDHRETRPEVYGGSNE